MSAHITQQDQDDHIPLSKLPGFIPGKRLHVSTLIRWKDTGVIGADGERIKLKSTRIGGRIYVRLSDLQAFLNRLNSRDDSPRETDADRLRRSREAGKALEALGC